MEPSVSLRSTIRDKSTVPCGLASRCRAPLVGVLPGEGRRLRETTTRPRILGGRLRTWQSEREGDGGTKGRPTARLIHLRVGPCLFLTNIYCRPF